MDADDLQCPLHMNLCLSVLVKATVLLCVEVLQKATSVGWCKHAESEEG